MTVVELYTSLNFGDKLHVVRVLMTMQVLAFHLVRPLVVESSVLFYVDTWLGFSWFLLLVFILMEIAYEIKTHRE